LADSISRHLARLRLRLQRHARRANLERPNGPLFEEGARRNQMVPEGQPKIAQRFNAGFATELNKVPKGRLKSAELVRPSLRDLTFHHSQPSVETLGYSHRVPPGFGLAFAPRRARLRSCSTKSPSQELLL
jgi:hypothetical protein